jgi:CheY-like chemotaxis protein
LCKPDDLPIRIVTIFRFLGNQLQTDSGCPEIVGNKGAYAMTTASSQLDLPRRILLVEDNETNQRLMTDYLNYCGYTVAAVTEGRQFAGAMTDFQPHLILLDLKLPDLDGYTLLTQIQARPDWQKVPVIVVSAYAFQRDQQRALGLGARRYLVKPIRLSQLTQAIDAELQYLDEPL